jgi:hypothetical protein
MGYYRKAIEKTCTHRPARDGNPSMLVCKPRKLIPKANYWFLEMKLGVDAMDQLNKAMKEEKPRNCF